MSFMVQPAAFMKNLKFMKLTSKTVPSEVLEDIERAVHNLVYVVKRIGKMVRKAMVDQANDAFSVLDDIEATYYEEVEGESTIRGNAKMIGKFAHDMQTVACRFQRESKQAKNVINIAGQIENLGRSMQANLIGVKNGEMKEGVKNQMKKLCAGVEEKVDKMQKTICECSGEILEVLSKGSKTNEILDHVNVIRKHMK